jgi:hypothetical protein
MSTTEQYRECCGISLREPIVNFMPACRPPVAEIGQRSIIMAAAMIASITTAITMRCNGLLIM